MASKRWKIDWDVVGWIVFTWYSVGLFPFVVLAGTGHILIGVAVWLGPIALIALMSAPFAISSALRALRRGLRYLRKHPPIQRIEENR